ncbi:hypothetical protein L9F63_002481, partial [Diploptera punctata]
RKKGLPLFMHVYADCHIKTPQLNLSINSRYGSVCDKARHGQPRVLAETTYVNVPKT